MVTFKKNISTKKEKMAMSSPCKIQDTFTDEIQQVKPGPRTGLNKGGKVFLTLCTYDV